MIDDLTADEPTLTSKHSPGLVLSEARQELKWSIEDVAANLNLRVRVIESLESDDYSDLPGPTFVRGYLKAYARLLGVDESEVVDNETILSTQSGSFSGHGGPVMSPSAFRPRRPRGSKAWLLWVGLIVLIVVAWSFSGLKIWGPDGVLTSLGIGDGGDRSDPSEISLSLDPESRTGTSSQ
ncbi:MAG: hypothetical protein DHS20C01_30900 [marine bacterium B5-7]|nr:MAG: hypothetical protein DHS20C01_30900 [marine bacterium B5-7]